MKNNNRSWRMFFIISIVLYFLALIGVVLLIRNIPNQYIKLQKKENTEIKNKISIAVKQNNITEYNNIIKNSYVDFIVYEKENNKIEYSSLGIEKNIQIINKNVNNNIISSKELIEVSRDGKNYEIWIINYFISPQKIFDIWIITLIVIISSLLTIIVIALLILFFKYIKPIQRLKETVQKISSYQLNLINDVTQTNNSEYDQISRELQFFSLELEENMKKTGYQYSILEQKLLEKNETVEYKNELLGSLAHDLKAPISLAVLKLDLLINDDNVNEVLNIKNKLESVIEDINGINNIIFNNDAVFLKQETIDIIPIIMNTVNEFEELFDSRSLIIDYEIDDKVIIKTNQLRFKQLIYNACSNIYNHANEGAEVVISCYVEGNKVILSFYNDSIELSEQELENIFSIFFKKGDNVRNSGLGMYTIKTIVNEMNGNISVKNYKKGILIEVLLDV